MFEMYAYCKLFGISPREYLRTPTDTINKMIQIDGEVKRYEKELIERESKKR